ncbi:hypothetical protein PIB30_010193 [Stylosanthes scabra]|uniref:Uncharacterized protein n=1 Tax=Stylosanthes scabra TaxID=79078 RepID=A0ABU6R5B9_9FABA|nr:hypothetical protein [Stylosanthes scabra]
MAIGFSETFACDKVVGPRHRRPKRSKSYANGKRREMEGSSFVRREMVTSNEMETVLLQVLVRVSRQWKLLACGGSLFSRVDNHMNSPERLAFRETCNPSVGSMRG